MRTISNMVIQKKNAFTLAEVLITLGIIGVLSAMTIPNLVSKLDHAAKISKLKKAHSVLNQAVKASSEENGTPDDWDTTLGTEVYLKKYIAPYMKITLYCNDYQTCNYDSDDPWHRYSNAESYNGFNVLDRIPFITDDGILYSFSRSGANLSDGKYDYYYIGSRAIFVDINGPGKPNRWGNDVFVFVRNNDGSVMPLGYNMTQAQLEQDCKKEGLCLYCAEVLRRLGWNSPKNYPW